MPLPSKNDLISAAIQIKEGRRSDHSQGQNVTSGDTQHPTGDATALPEVTDYEHTSTTPHTTTTPYRPAVETASRVGKSLPTTLTPEKKKKSAEQVAQELFDKKVALAEARKTKKHYVPATRPPLAKIIPVTSKDWDDAEAEDYPMAGVGAETFKKPTKNPKTRVPVKKARFELRDRDFRLLAFLAKYKYASRAQIERHFGVNNLSRRLAQLKSEGLLWNESVTRTQWLWTPSAAGMDLVDSDFPILANGRIKVTTIGHTLGLVNIGSDLETGKLDTSLLPEHLQQNPEGENVVHEREIAFSYNQHLKLVNDPRVLRNTYLEEWGNQEWTYLIHTTGAATKTHKPDLVIDRGGASKDIAIELELSPKRTNEWKQILNMYKGSPYGYVIYYTHKRSIAQSLNKINECEVGMGNLSVRTYRPMRSDIPFWG